MKMRKKLKKAFRRFSEGNFKHEDTPKWIAALSAIAGAVASALVDEGKRRQLLEVASDAKHKVTDILIPHPSHDRSPKEHRTDHHHHAH